MLGSCVGAAGLSKAFDRSHLTPFCAVCVCPQDVGQNTWELWELETGGGWFHPVSGWHETHDVNHAVTREAFES